MSVRSEYARARYIEKCTSSAAQFARERAADKETIQLLRRKTIELEATVRAAAIQIKRLTERIERRGLK